MHAQRVLRDEGSATLSVVQRRGHKLGDRVTRRQRDDGPLRMELTSAMESIVVWVPGESSERCDQVWPAGRVETYSWAGL